jgi:galactonate dehydratase
VWRLLGGKVRDRIRMYGWLSLEPTGDYIDLYAKSINENIEGFTAYKTCPIPPMQMIEQPHVLHAIRDNIVLLRDKVDKRIDLALDFHGRCTPAMVSLLELFVILNYDCFVVSTTDSYD